MRSRPAMAFALAALAIPLGFLLPAPSKVEATTETPPAPAKAEDPLSLAKWPASEAALRGKVLYEANCVGCHGPEGRGDGTASPWLDPKPRNFQKGYFKFRTTGSGQFPMEEDLLRTVTNGLPGSSMPGFPLVTERSRRDLVAYVLHLASFGKAQTRAKYLMEEEGANAKDLATTRLPELSAHIQKEQLDGRKRIAIGDPPATTPEILARGKAIYTKQCASCHGATGRGDGSSSYTLRDWQEAEIRPRDFTSGTFRAGNTARDLFTRMRSGLNGTPMPAAVTEPDADVWAVVLYVMSLKQPGTIPSTRRMGADGGN